MPPIKGIKRIGLWGVSGVFVRFWYGCMYNFQNPAKHGVERT
jgi:hypothetical protein